MTYPVNKIVKLVAVLGFILLMVLFFILIDTLENAPSRRNRVSIEADLKFFCPSDGHERTHLDPERGLPGRPGAIFSCRVCGRRFSSTTFNLETFELETLELEGWKRKDYP